METVYKIIDRYPEGGHSVIQVLQDIQNEFNYLPRERLVEVSQVLRIPLSRLYSIATFYSAFSLNPRGKHVVTVCMGTACHVRGAAAILSEFERKLGVKPGQTTNDKKYTLETVNCLGCCAIGPIVVFDKRYIGEFKLDQVDKLLKEK
ncbi:NADH-quinone oxidoreductase subunit NuoE [candidate division WOR-3 bacterium]|nr:NADH-quinone oxidoreductase subunit NuoE [candidate division WOR-3 bacterium]